MTNGIFLYVLAVAARRFRISVHAFCVLSNHFHLVVSDPEARLPAFEQYLDSLVARALNACIGRWETFWAPPHPSAVALSSPSDVIAKIAYTLANPVAAGLVKFGSEWPGLRSTPEQIGSGALVIPRPAGFFRANGPMPETVELELTVPPGVESAAEFRDQAAAAVAAAEQQARRDIAAQNRGFVGVAKLLAQKPTARPAPTEPRRGLSPLFAGGDKRERLDALARLEHFVKAYRKARADLTAGVRDVLFPAGTYLLRVSFGVRCASVG